MPKTPYITGYSTADNEKEITVSISDGRKIKVVYEKPVTMEQVSALYELMRKPIDQVNLAELCPD